MLISQLPTIPQPPADYPYVVVLLAALLAVAIFAAYRAGVRVAKFLGDLLDKLEKRADDERARADKQAEEAIRRWELGEESKRQRGERLDTKIEESNREIAEFYAAEQAKSNARITALEKKIANRRNSVPRVKQKTPPKEGG
jgi:hypothetical protein